MMSKPLFIKDGPTFRQIFDALNEAGLLDSHLEWNGYYGTTEDLEVSRGCLSIFTDYTEDRKHCQEFRYHLDTGTWEIITLEIER